MDRETEDYSLKKMNTRTVNFNQLVITTKKLGSREEEKNESGKHYKAKSGKPSTH